MLFSYKQICNYIMDKVKLFDSEEKKAKKMCECDAFHEETAEGYECLYNHVLKQCKKQWNYVTHINNNLIILDPIDIASATFQNILEYHKRYDYSKNCWATVFWFAFKNARNDLLDEEKKNWMSYEDSDEYMDNVIDNSISIEDNLDKKIKTEKMINAVRKELWEKRVSIIQDCIDTNRPVLTVMRERGMSRNEYNSFMKKRKKLKLF